MKSFPESKMAAKLRDATHLCPNLGCVARWSSSSEYALAKLVGEDDSFDVSFLSKGEIGEIDTLRQLYYKLGTVTKELKKEKWNIWCSNSRLSRAQIEAWCRCVNIRQSSFEYSVVKINEFRHDSLTSEERALVAALKSCNESSPTAEKEESLSYAQMQKVIAVLMSTLVINIWMFHS